MIAFFRLLFCMVLIGLVSCATDEKIQVNPQSLTLCKMTCSQHLESCSQNCTNNCPRCSAESSYTSTKNYLKYVHEKQVEGGYIARGLKSYRDPLQCRKVSCNCISDFLACKQNCVGVIQKRLRPVPKCT
jgi:hypothetical protein